MFLILTKKFVCKVAGMNFWLCQDSNNCSRNYNHFGVQTDFAWIWMNLQDLDDGGGNVKNKHNLDNFEKYENSCETSVGELGQAQ